MVARSSFDDYVAEGTVLNNYAHIFDLLTKMRQAVGHPYCVVFSKTNSAKRLLEQQQQSSASSANVVANGSVDCDICHEPFTERVVTSCCGAGFCRSCVIEYLAGTGGASTPCPSCNNPLSIDLNQASTDTVVDDGTLTVSGGSPSTGGNSGNSGSGPAMPSLKDLPHVPTGSILRRINLADFTTSTKIEVLVQELIEMRQQRPGSKCLVFSQFVNMLDLVRWRLHNDPFLADMGLGVRILHGGMDVKSRDATLQDFREDKDVRILLMSLKSGGVALNLTVASEGMFCFLTCVCRCFAFLARLVVRSVFCFCNVTLTTFCLVRSSLSFYWFYIVYLMDNWWNPAAEAQAIDRTHRLGQHRPIRAVRFIAEGTVEERVLQLQEKKRMVFDGTVGRDAGSLKALSVTDMKALFT
jgi:DNA repair protein RAD16